MIMYTLPSVHAKRLVSEFLGVFLLVVTVGQNVIMSSPAVTFFSCSSA